MSEDQFVHFLGLLRRTGNVVQGHDRCLKGVRTGSVRLVALDPGASENTKKAIRNACGHCDVRLVEMSRPDVLGKGIGKPAVLVVGICDAALAAQAAEKYEKESGGGRVWPK